MQLNANSPKFLLAVLILAGLSLVYTITATVPANQPTDQAPVLTTVAPRTQVAQVASSCTVGDLTCGLVGWWKLDEGSGTTASDSSGSGNTGTLTGSALPTWTAGKIGVALSFNGTNQYVTVNDSSSLAFGTGGFTVSFWIDPTTDSQPTNNSLIWKMYPSLSNGWYIALSPTGKIYPYYRSDAPHYSYQFYSNATIPANVWTHVAVVTDRSAGLIRIYVNGAPDATYNIAGWGSFDTSSALLMGSLFSGSLDDVRIYDRTLSASEVSSLYQAGTNTTTAPQASAPIISNIATSNISPSGAAISWTTDTAASSEILYGLASTYGSNTTADNTQVTSHSQTLSGLLANTTYHYAVVSTDSVGTTQSADQTFTTAQAVQSPSGTTYDLNWYFNGPGNGTVACSLGGGAEQVCPKTFSANTVVAMTEYPGTNSSFTGWGGDCWGPALNASGNICTLTMNGPHTFSASFAQNTAAASSRVFYIATDGSDSNSGTSKSSPWLHAPGMADCTGACATTVPSPGDSFILKGGDVWHVGNGSLPSSIGGSWKWSWGGDAAAGLYLGVDHSWYDASTCGSTWCAPIFDGDNPLSKTPVASCAYPAGDPFLSAAGTTYLTIDGLEFRGMCQQGVPAYGQATYLVWGSAAATGMSHDVTENIYVHGWTHVPYACTLVNGTETGNCMGADGSLSFGDGNTLAHYRCDGSDSDPSLACTYGSLYDVHDSFFNNVSQGILGSGFHTVHDNLIENVPPGLDGVAHTNGFELLNEYPGTNFVYNNVVRNVTAGVTGWSCPNAKDYYFNNVIYDNQQEPWDIASDFCGTTGSVVFINNTFADTGAATWGGLGGPNQTFYNTLLIDSAITGGATQNSSIALTKSQASTAGLSDTSGFDPTGSSCNGITPCPIGAGQNMSSYCTFVPGLCADMSGNARPATGPWDVGAYVFGSTVATNPPASGPTPSPTPTPTQSTQTSTSTGQSSGSGTISSGSGASVGGGGFGGGGGGGGFGGGAAITTGANSGASNNSVAMNSNATPCVASPSAIPASALSLTIGTRGPEVTNLQTFLVIMGYLNRIYITGYFGPLTKAALTSYQSAHPSTCSNTQAPSNNNQTSSNKQIPNFTRSLKLGMVGNDVKNLQIFLNQHGFTISQSGAGSSGHETSYFGPATFRALIRFQNAYANQILAPYGLSQGTGFFGPSTMKEANSLI